LAGKVVYIALGSNVGDRAATLERAIAAMNLAGIRVSQQSSFYVTEPVDAPGQARVQ
jgi:7,8-dihydro-6-hydroxymethylpterin-pyrophosphokinase